MFSPSTLLSHYDYRFLAVAAALGFMTALTTFRVYGRSLTARGGMRQGWLFVGSVATGLGVWAANFTSHLAFDPQTAIAYDGRLAALSMVLAVVLAAPVGLIVLRPNVWHVSIFGGLYIGLGLGLLQVIGIATWKIAGTIVWHELVLASAIAVSSALFALALAVARPSRRWWERAAGAALLTLAVAGQHFVAMTGIEIVPDANAPVPDGMPQQTMAAIVIGVTALLVGAAFALAGLDRRTNRLARRRMRELADAALEGLVLCEGGVIVDANAGFRTLAGLDRGEVRGRRFEDFVHPAQRSEIPQAPGQMRTLDLVGADGAPVRVEVVARNLGSDRARRVLAVRDLRELKAAEERIRHLAHHDALTGLPNRVTFRERLDRALEVSAIGGTSVAALCLDLDRFKEVNDAFGHAAGDYLLVEAAHRLAAELGEGDILARLGGDEFAIIQCNARQPDAAGDLADRLIAAISRPFQLDGQTASIGLSVGIALFPEQSQSARDLLGNADTALYRAKSDGRGSFRFFDTEMDSVVRDRRALAQDLRRALADDELEIYYQPQVSVTTGEVTGFEALARWRHPQRGQVPPSVFIAVAEENGLVLALGEWALRAACQEAARWSKPLRIAVNLSPVQFQLNDLPERVASILLETGLAPARLELEITETVLIKDFHRALGLLRRIKALGVAIAMDDFGTGYSSLSTLQAFPFDKLKIDRVFVDKVETQPQAAAIVRAILSLGRSLSIPVTAEGVETEGQVAFLAEENCDALQGYLLGRPGPIANYLGAVEGAPPVRDGTGVLLRSANEGTAPQPLAKAG